MYTTQPGWCREPTASTSWEAGMYVLQCPMEAPAPVWEATEPVGRVGHLSVVLYGIVGTYLGTFNVVPLRDSNAEDQLVDFWKCCCKYSTGFFLFL